MRRSIFLAAVCAAFVPTVAAASTLPTQPQHPPQSTVAPQPTATTCPSATSAAPQRKAAPAPTTQAPQPPASTHPVAPPQPQPTTKAAPPTPRTVYLAPVTAYHSQAAVDQGNLVLWGSQPWRIAGHDNMGWAFLYGIPTGSIVVVTTGPAAGRYNVVGHRWSPTKGDPVMPTWMTDWPDDGLILQTCTRESGTGFTLARRV